MYLCLALSSCENDDNYNEQVTLLNGEYTGTFQRKLSWSNSSISNITLTFQFDKWSGSSDIIKYPALCRGTFSIVGDSIVFVNECAWTAEFDWSLILSGKYKIERHGDQIEFYRNYRSMVGNFKDLYKIQDSKNNR
jgi:hypothetical protein